MVRVEAIRESGSKLRTILNGNLSSGSKSVASGILEL
jgi:hypothetical protein